MHNFTPVASLAGGLLIGAASVWLLAANGRIAGISGILHGLFAQPPGDRSWRLLFITGLIAAGFAWHWYAGPAPVREGFGLGRFSMRSLVAVAIFMATGIATAVLMRHVLGVPS